LGRTLRAGVTGGGAATACAVPPGVLVPPFMVHSSDADRPFEAARRLTLSWCGRTVRGLVRQSNEDMLWACPIGNGAGASGDAKGRGTTLWPGLLLCAADGMGGAAAGEVASGLAVDIMGAEMGQRTPPGAQAGGPEALARVMVAAVEAAHAAIRQESENDDKRRGMGTTLTAAWMVCDELLVAQIGDSRAYLFRAGHLKQLTKDQSLAGKLLEDGVLTEEQIEQFPGKHIILQALGTEEPLDVVTEHLRLLPGDLVLLCTDGLSGVVSNRDLEDDLRRGGTPEDLCLRLIALAEKRGGPDNITVVIAKVESGR
jgi:PPM family protein phosphatase